MSMNWARVGAVCGFLTVAIGAFGAHGLKVRLAETGYAEQFQTGVHYQAIHALALLLSSNAARPGRWRSVAGWGFLLGIVLFSGSLFVLGVTGARWLGAVTPFGGLAFLAGWVGLIAGTRDRSTG